MAHEQPPPKYVLTEDTFAALIRLFMSPANPRWHLSPDAGGYADNTKSSWGRELRFAARPDTLGPVTTQTIRPALVQAFLDGLSDRPGKQGIALSALRQVDEWANVRDLLPRSITFGVKVQGSTGGHMPWTAEQVAVAERVSQECVSRLISLGAYTGQRVSDLIRMCPTDIESYKGMDGIHVLQKKTGRKVWVPIVPELARVMEGWKLQPGPFLRRPSGLPWFHATTASMAWIRERQAHDELREHMRIPLVVHGLRGHKCVTLARAGLNDHQIGDLVGMSVPMVSRYTRFSKQQDNAIAAVFQIRGTSAERPGPGDRKFRS